METDINELAQRYLSGYTNRIIPREPKLKETFSCIDEVIGRIAALYQLFVGKNGSTFQLDPPTMRNIERVAHWAFESPKKGLLLIGTKGNGKTTMLRVLNFLLQDAQFFTAKEIWENEHKSQDLRDLHLNYFVDFPLLLIDDLGIEEESCKVFGETRHPLEDVITQRYARDRTTIITTNLSLKAIEERYGGRVLDRLYEMYTMIKYDAPSYRRIR